MKTFNFNKNGINYTVEKLGSMYICHIEQQYNNIDKRDINNFENWLKNNQIEIIDIWISWAESAQRLEITVLANN